MSDEQHVRPFAEFLQRQSRGTTHRELSDGLHNLVARVMETGKPGTITLKVKVDVLKGSKDTLTVSDEITLKLPEHDRQASIWFQDQDGNLTRSDPEQLAMPLQPVPEAVAYVDGDGEIHPIGEAQ